jgi:dihydrofolate reductase
MRKLIMKMSVSIDGFVSGPNNEKDWVFRSSDEGSRAWVLQSTRESGLIIMGRKSFEEMSPYWPTAAGPLAEAMNEIPKAVFTKKGFKVPPAANSSSAAASWAATQVVEGDLAEKIKQLKQQPGKPIIAFGGAGFMRSLIGTGEIDEYNLVVHPVVLGGGLPIFTDVAKPFDLRLTDVKSFSGGVVIHTYQPA